MTDGQEKEEAEEAEEPSAGVEVLPSTEFSECVTQNVQTIEKCTCICASSHLI